MRVRQDVHRKLREATAALHAEVEAIPCFAKLMTTEVGERDILTALTVLHTHYATWEPMVFDSLADMTSKDFLDQRRRLPALQADLAQFTNAKPVAARITKRLSPSVALGWLYVHEGSRHGALVIRKQIVRHLGEDVASQFSFFAQNSKDVSSLWEETLELIERIALKDRQQTRVISGARAAFSELRDTGAAHHAL